MIDDTLFSICWNSILPTVSLVGIALADVLLIINLDASPDVLNVIPAPAVVAIKFVVVTSFVVTLLSIPSTIIELSSANNDPLTSPV